MRSKLNLLLKVVKNIWKALFPHGADILLNFWKHHFCREIYWQPELCPQQMIVQNQKKQSERRFFLKSYLVNNCQSERHYCCNDFSKISHFHIGCCWSFISYYYAPIFQLGSASLALREYKMGRRGSNSPSTLNEDFPYLHNHWKHWLRGIFRSNPHPL